jgi:hypothetical protein
MSAHFSISDSTQEAMPSSRSTRRERSAQCDGGIERAHGTALGIAGLWERWKSPAGEEVPSFAMLTINCDEHPLLKRFHKHFDEKGRAERAADARALARRPLRPVAKRVSGGSTQPLQHLRQR